jgi:hypothetical protein
MYKSDDRDLGYNIEPGGVGASHGIKLTREIVDQIVIRLKMQGYSNDEISRMTGFSNRQVIYILTKFKKV